MDGTNHGEDFPKEHEVVDLLPCTLCNRSFSKNVFQRHSVLCKNNKKKHKKKFHSSKQRKQGTDMNAYFPRVKKTQNTPVGVEKSKNNWKEKHEHLIRILRAARGEKPDDEILLSKPIDCKTCPHCERTFGKNSYDRHVEFCREKSRRIPATPVVDQSAKKRLEIRTQYRAPPLKSLCTATKETYSPTAKSSFRNFSNVPVKMAQSIKNIKTSTSSTNTKLSYKFHLSSELKKNDQLSKSVNGSKNAINLPKKPNNINETAVKKPESTYYSSFQNRVKQKVNIANNK